MTVPKIIRGRHTGYTAAGIPIITEVPTNTCAATPVDYPGARHGRYTASGIPVVIESWKCCRVYSETRVEDDAYTSGSPAGITDVVLARSTNAQNCVSGHNKDTILTYDNVDRWTGSLALRSGSVQLEFLVDDMLPDNDPDKFTLRWKDCTDVDWQEQTSGYTCADPLQVVFELLDVADCCDCPAAHTSENATINIEIWANCKKTTWARHVDYTADGTPIVATENCGEVAPSLGCDAPHCGLVATVTGDCECLNGTYDLDWVSTDWQAPGFGPAVGECSDDATITLLCTENEDGVTSTLRLTVTCGASDSGFDEVIIDNDETENLDVTFDVEMTGPTPTACGDCVWQWVDMTQSWTFISDDCTGDCNCTGTEPSEPGDFDGQQVEIPCAGTVVECCQGSITVRVTR